MRSAAAVLAAASPSLLAHNVSPSPTFLNQALAFALWGWFVCAVALAQRPIDWRVTLRATAAPLLALALLACAAAWSMSVGPLPASLGWSAIGTIAVAALMLVGAGASSRDTDAFAAFALGFAVAGVANVGVAAIQVFAPALADGSWVAASAAPGRAVGNLRQPNHLSSLLLWSMIGTAALVELRRIGSASAAALMSTHVLGIVLTASRTGMVGVALLALWGAADRRLQRGTRLLLLAAPVVYAVFWAAMAVWADASSHAFFGQQRLAESDVSASRFGIWSDTLEMIRAQPWAGVGFGLYNFAWSLSVMPQRPVAFFDHAHNLPLHLAAELGLPLAGLVTVLLVAGLVLAWRRSSPAHTDEKGAAAAGRCATAMIVTIGLHSLLEYPLWYAYFLLPAAWAWGFALGRPPADADRTRHDGRGAFSLVLAAALVSIGAALSVADYMRVVRIFSASPAPLDERIADGKRSVFFAHHAHYAAATTGDDAAAQLASCGVSAFHLLDTRLMTTWAKAFAATGDIDRARYLADRLREFRNPESQSFFAPCTDMTPSPGRPFQCEPPSRALDWRDFVPR